MARGACIGLFGLRLTALLAFSPLEAAARPPADPAALEEAGRAFELAREHYRAGRYDAAVVELERALELDPDGKDLVYNLALVEEKRGRLPRSLALFKRYRGMEENAGERNRVDDAIERIEGALAHAEATARDAPPDEPAEAPDVSRVEPEPEEAPAPRNTSSRIDAWVVGTGAVAVAGIVVGAVFGARALAAEPEARTGSQGSYADLADRQATAHQFAIVADVSLLIGIVSGASCAVLYLGRAPEAARATSPSARRQRARRTACDGRSPCAD